MSSLLFNAPIPAKSSPPAHPQGNLGGQQRQMIGPRAISPKSTPSRNPTPHLHSTSSLTQHVITNYHFSCISALIYALLPAIISFFFMDLVSDLDTIIRHTWSRLACFDWFHPPQIHPFSNPTVPLHTNPQKGVPVVSLTCCQMASADDVSNTRSKPPRWRKQARRLISDCIFLLP